jgi:hypothetical protein
MPLRKSSPRSAGVPKTTSLLLLAASITYGATVLAGPIKGRITGQDKLLPDVYVEASKPDAHRFTWREP